MGCFLGQANADLPKEISMADLTKSDVAKIRARMQQALSGIEAELGLTFKLGNCRFGATYGTFKLDFVKPNEAGEVVDKSVALFRANAEVYGLSPNDLGLHFTSPTGKSFTLTGMNPKGKEYKFLARCSQDGRTYKFKASQIIAYKRMG
jgi:hypothetical protein